VSNYRDKVLQFFSIEAIKVVASTATCLAFPALQPYTLYSKENDKLASGATKEIMQQHLGGGGEHR